MLPLFAYGTLRDPELHEALFGRVLARRPAVLEGWRVVADDDGYYFVEPAAGESVEGELVTMDADALARADRWEDVPWYVREVTTVRLPDGASTRAWIYLRPGATGSPVVGAGFARRPAAEVLADARALGADDDARRRKR